MTGTTNARRAQLVAAASVLLAALAGCGSDDDKPAAQPSATSSSPRAALPIMVRGTFTLELPNFLWSEETMTCAGTGGHDDIAAGTQVVVTDPAGVNLAVGQLEAGQPQVDPEDQHRATECLFSFKIPGVASGKGIYGVEVSNRGKVQFKESAFSDFIALELT